jgi:hypothetical protein
MDSMDHQDLSPTVQRIANELLPAMQGDIRRIETEVLPSMQGDIRRIETEVLPSMQGDIRRIETEVLPSMQGDLRTMQGDMRRLDGSLRRVILEIVDLKDGQDRTMKKLETFDELKDQMREVLKAVDSFSGEARSYGAAKTLHGQSLTEAQVKLNDHERRIKGLEDRLQ